MLLFALIIVTALALGWLSNTLLGLLALVAALGYAVLTHGSPEANWYLFLTSAAVIVYSAGRIAVGRS